MALEDDPSPQQDRQLLRCSQVENDPAPLLCLRCRVSHPLEAWLRATHRAHQQSHGHQLKAMALLMGPVGSPQPGLQGVAHPAAQAQQRRRVVFYLAVTKQLTVLLWTGVVLQSHCCEQVLGRWAWLGLNPPYPQKAQV